MYFALKAAISGLLIALISEIARRYPATGGFVASLPLLSILAVIWLWRDTGNVETVAAHLQATFWLVLPTLPMFLLIPYLLRHGTGFWLALLMGCGLTLLLYGFSIGLMKRSG